MLFVALSILVNVFNVILSKEFKRILFHLRFLKRISNIMSNFLQPSNNITSNPSIIKFNSGDKKQCFDIVEKNVTICGSVGTHDHGSSKVKLKNIVDYKWEVKDYSGHIIAVHLDGKHIAYAIKVSNKSSGIEGMVRVANAFSGPRALIKGMSGEVLDLQFAHLENNHILACIDEKTLHIYKIDMLSDNLICNEILQINDPIKNHTPKYDKISWCPYVNSTMPDESDDDVVDISQLIVWARGGTFQCFNVNSIINANGIGKHSPDTLSTGYLKWEDSTVIITWVLLSPDGSTLGVASDDGYIRFYQMYFHEKEPRCLHEWKPHHGKIISSFFFLDDLTTPQTDAYWKYALTGAECNTEFKIWDCGTWTCLQTITFAPDLGKKSSFIAEIDRTSSYLVLTNRETRGLYVLQIIKQSDNGKDESSDCDNDQNDDDDDDDDDDDEDDENLNSNIIKKASSPKQISKSKKTSSSFAFIKSVSEFPLSSSILSFCIVDAAVRKYKCALNEDDNYLIDELDDYDEENNALFCVVVRLFIVQPKSVQECHILYQPTLSEQCEIKSSISNESLGEGFEDFLTDISGSGSTNTNHLHHLHHHQTSTSSSLSSSSNQEKTAAATLNEKTNNLLAIEKKLQSTSPANLSNTSMEKMQKQKSSSPINPNTSSSTSGSSNLKNVSSQQLNLMIPEAFSSTSGTGDGRVTDKKPSDCVSSEVLSTILMLASVTGSSNAANKTENVNLLNLVNNKVIEDEEKRKLKQQKKGFSTLENSGTQQQTNAAEIILASGGSSPSREVQEIMSHNCKAAYYNEQQQQQQQKQKTNLQSNDFSQHVSDNIINIDDLFSKSQTKVKQTIMIPTVWPKVPDVRNINKHSTAPDLQNSSNKIMPSTSLEINNLSSKINQLIDVIQMQSSQINALKSELTELKNMKTDQQQQQQHHSLSSSSSVLETDSKNFNEYTLKMEKQFTKILEDYLIRYEDEQKQRFEAFITAKNVQNREMRDEILHYFNQFMFNQFIEKITNVLIKEIQRIVLPVIIDKVDVIKEQIQAEVAQKLAITDNVLRENISQVCKSKSIIDAFGNSVLLGVKSGLQATYIESMSSTLIPAYEKSSQEMFKQLHETFSRGIKEVMKQFDSYLSQLQPVEACTDEILEKLGDIQKQFDHNITRNRNNIIDLTSEIKKDMKLIECNLLRNLSELIQNEIKRSFESQAASLEDSVLSVVRSQAHTPAPMVYDVQDQIKLLLCQGQINKAFHQALIANDLSLVEYALEKADHKSVFSPCALEQTVLLSLIQQISADMNSHNEIKQRYLSDAILNLNLNDPISKEHAPKVLKELYKNCQYFLTNYPKNPLCSNVRMIMMAIQGMGIKLF